MARLRAGCGAQRYNEDMNDFASSAHAQPLARTVLPIAVLTILWGCNWPMLKIGVTEMAPLTFRAVTLPFAALGLLLVAWLSGDNVRIPREWWTKVAVLAAFNITGWNGIVLFGVQQMPAGRSAILAFTMPIWATLIASVVLHERLSRRKLAGLPAGDVGHRAADRRRDSRHPACAIRCGDDPHRRNIVGYRHRFAAQVGTCGAANHADAAG